DGLGHRGVGGGEVVEAFPEQFLVSVPLGARRRFGVEGVGQVAEGGGDAGELVGRDRCGGGGEQVVEGAGRDRHFVVEIAHHERTALARQVQLAGFEDAADLVAEDGYEHLGRRTGVGATGPVDVEGGGVLTRRPV